MHRGLKYSVVFGCYVVGFAAFLCSATMNYHYVQQLASDASAQAVNGASSLTLDVAVMVLAAAFGVLMGVGRWATSTIVGLLVLAPITLYGVTSSVGYVAANRIAKSEASDRRAEALSQADEKRRIALKDQAVWLRGQATISRRQSDRELYIAESSKVIEMAAKVDDATLDARVVMGDAQAEVFARLTGLPARDVQITMAIALAVLLVMVKVSMFALGSALAAMKVPLDRRPDSGEPVGGDREKSTEVEPCGAENVVRFERSPSPPPAQAHVSEFVATLDFTKPIPTQVLSAAYQEFCAARGIDPLGRNKLAARMEEYGVYTLRRADGSFSWRSGENAFAA